VQARGQQITELNTGDVVFAPNGEGHWHGASPEHFMTHHRYVQPLGRGRGNPTRHAGG
jgi:quercetin dioxygenase-like cupin family protein